MKKIYTIIVLILIVLGILFFMSSNKKAEAPILDEGPKTVILVPEETNTTVKEFIVSGQNFSFTPSTITVKKGDKVKITFKNTLGFHDFKIDEYGLATKQMQAPFEEVLEFTADKEGSFEYYCSVGQHRAMGMKGTLVVE
jgi:plastocyanin